MRNFLMWLMATLTQYPRYHPEEAELDHKMHWSKEIWISNIFRAWEWLFGRQFGIRVEMSSSVSFDEKDNQIITYGIYSFEAFCSFIEWRIREFIKLEWLPLKLLLLEPAQLGVIPEKRTPWIMFSIALDTSTIGTKTSTTPITWSHTCTGSNLVIHIVGANNATSATLSTPTYNSVSATIVGSQRNYDASDIMGLYYLLAPSTGSHSVSIAFGGTGPNCNGAAISWSGVAQSGQPDAVGGATNQSSANPSISVTTVADNCWVVGAVISSSGTVPTAGLTARQGAQYNILSTFEIQDTNGVVHPAGSKTVNWTQSSNFWGAQAASFSPASGVNTGNFFHFFRP